MNMSFINANDIDHIKPGQRIYVSASHSKHYKRIGTIQKWNKARPAIKFDELETIRNLPWDFLQLHNDVSTEKKYPPNKTLLSKRIQNAFGQQLLTMALIVTEVDTGMTDVQTIQVAMAEITRLVSVIRLVEEYDK